jgi:MFS family permease
MAVNATGQLLAFYLDNQLKGYSPSTVSWIGSVQTFVEFSFAMATGRWFDNHGARTLNIIGLVLANASIVALACESSVPTLGVIVISFPANTTPSLLRVLSVLPRHGLVRFCWEHGFRTC